MQRKKKCFVIMPVSKTRSCTTKAWTSIFDEMIKPAITGSKLGFKCERSKPRSGNLIGDILNELDKADVVIADLTDMNPNVFYELGVRHTLRNRTILIAQDMKYVPSDLKSYWVITYKKGLLGLQDFKDKMRDILREMMKNPEKPDSPVAHFLGEKNVNLLSQERSANIKKLTALVGELSHNISAADSFLSTLKKSEKSQRKNEGYIVGVARFDNACLALLLSTRYVSLPGAFLRTLMNINKIVLGVNNVVYFWGDERYFATVEAELKKILPSAKTKMGLALKGLNQVRLDYMNNNFQEETTPVLLLSSEEHGQYIASTQ